MCPTATTWHLGAASPDVCAPSYVPPIMGKHVRAPSPQYAHPLAMCVPSPPCHGRLLCHVHLPLPYTPPLGHACSFFVRVSFTMRASIAVRAPHPRPYPCAPPQYKFHKVVPHSTTWTSRPSTTKRWLTARCLDADHTFYTHSHKNVRGWSCMHVRSHVVYIFIVNACQTGHIKLLASL
jgi:hypothetical protein